MPKQIWKIEDFHGGINSNSDPRDLSPSESPSIQDISIDSVGRLKTMGKWDTGTLKYNFDGSYSDDIISGAMTLTISQASLGNISEVDDYYVNMYLTFNEGDLTGNSYRIVYYDKASNSATIKFKNMDGTDVADLTASLEHDNFKIYGEGNITSPLLSNRGLFTFGQDRKLDGTESSEFYTFLYDNDASGNIDIKDSTGWNTSYIKFSEAIEPIFYVADGNVRICDLGFGLHTSKWFGYVPETYFKGLRANSPYGVDVLGWATEGKDILTPTKGKCSIGDTSREYYQTAGEGTSYDLSIGDISGYPLDKVDEGALNLQVGIQHDTALGSTGPNAMPAGEPNVPVSCHVDSTMTPTRPLGITQFTSIVTGTQRGAGSGLTDTTIVCWDDESFILTESKSLIIPIMFPELSDGSSVMTTSFGNLEGDIVIKITNQSAANSNVTTQPQNTQAQWKFPVTDLVGNAWNFLVCTQSNVQNIPVPDPPSTNGNFEWGKSSRGISIHAKSKTGFSPTFLCNRPLLAETVIDGFQPGDYTFYYSNLFDEELQESLPFKFKDTTPTEYTGLPDTVGNTGNGQWIQDTVLATSTLGEKRLSGSLIYNNASVAYDSTNRMPTVGFIKDSGTTTTNNANKTDSIKVSETWDMGFATSVSYCIPKLDINRLNIVGAPILLDFTLYYCGNRGGATGQKCTQVLTDDSIKAIHDETNGLSENLVSWGHGLDVGDPIYFSTIGNVTGITAGTIYYVSETLDTVDTISRFKISTLPGGASAGDIALAGTASHIQYFNPVNKRVRGSRMYYKTSGNDNFFLIGENDYILNGFRWLPEGDTLAYTFRDHTGVGNEKIGPVSQYTSKIVQITPSSANLIDTYRSINGFSGHTKSISAQYKTAVVNGRRAYVGNIKQDGKIYPDRIVKSRVNKFDVFPSESGILDVAIRDGENIIKLEAYADRILQFKENSLYIINVSENVDFLEDTYRNKGCAYDYHVTKTDVGIAWFNKHGAYLYDGQRIHELLERESLRLLSEDYMIDFTTNSGNDLSMTNTMIGYIPKKKNIIIRNGSNNVLIYDFVIGSWTKGVARLDVDENMTNFALDSDQNLFYIDGIHTTIKTWNPSSSSTSNFLYLGGDLDFGQPAQRKKIYNVQISYRGDGLLVVPEYGVNGNTPGSSFTDSVLANAGVGSWTHIKLTPSSPINNVYSFQLKLSGTASSTFEINDISIVYRLKGVK